MLNLLTNPLLRNSFSTIGLKNALVYNGHDTEIMTSNTYSIPFICEFHMAVYPFDTQKCSLIFTADQAKSNVSLKVKSVIYSGPVDLSQYFVKETVMSNFEISAEMKGLKVDLIFGRRILSSLLTTYLPTILICIVSFSTNYFKVSLKECKEC